MRPLLTPEQTAFAATLRAAVSRAHPVSAVRADRNRGLATMSGGLRAALARCGAFGVAVDERHGGGGGGLVDVGVVLFEAGASLCPLGLRANLVFVEALKRYAPPAVVERWVQPATSGDLLGAVTAGADIGPAIEQATATRAGGQWVVNGRYPYVLGAMGCDVLLAVAASVEGGAQGFLLNKHDQGLNLVPRQVFDRSDQATVELDDVVVDPRYTFPLPAHGGPANEIDNIAVAFASIEMCGVVSSALERTSAYVKERRQFGRPLGSFQAVQHAISGMREALDGARLAAFHALWCLQTGAPAEGAVAVAKLAASEAALMVTQTAHQLHGGFGFAQESNLSLWSERARSSALLGGGVEVQLSRIADLVARGYIMQSWTGTEMRGKSGDER